MKKIILILVSIVSLSVVANSALAGGKFKFDLDDAKIIIDLGSHHHKKHHHNKYKHKNHHHSDYHQKKHHSKKHKSHRYSSRNQYTNEMYCDEHRVYHHHHGDDYHSHDYGKRHHSHHDHTGHEHYTNSGYQMNEYHDYTSHCWPVQKQGYWKGRKALVGGQMCRDSGGNSYVVPSSRYLIKYKRYH